MGKHLNGKKFNAGLPQGPILEPLFPNLHKLFVWWNLIFGESHHSSQLFHIRMIRHNNWTMISIKLVIGLIHGKCVLTQIPQKNRNKWFFKGFVQMKIILSNILIIYQSPRLPFKNISGCILIKNSIAILM